MTELAITAPQVDEAHVALEAPQTTIAHLRIGQKDPVLEAKVYRKWISRNANETREMDFCCILVDREGAAIQAFMNLDDHIYFDSKLEAKKAFRITNFFVRATNSYMQTLENGLSLTFGRVTSFTPLPGKESEFPDHHFEIVPYAQLSSKIPFRDPNTDQMVYPRLTDFLGCMRSISGLIPFVNTIIGPGHMRKVSMESLDGSTVELTMWNELATHFDKEQYDKIAFPAVLVITACRVSRYRGVFQLSATSATHYYINVDTHVITEAKRLFRDKYNLEPPLPVNRYRSTNIEEEKKRNRQTLNVLLKQNPASYEGVWFVCEATITGYVGNRGWNYPSCVSCNQVSACVDGIYICKDHAEQIPTPYRYNFKAIANDGTANAEFTFFTEAGEKLTRASCMDVRAKHMQRGVLALPEELTSAIGKKHLFQIQFATKSQKGAGRFIVKDILDLQPLNKEKTPGTLAITCSTGGEKSTLDLSVSTHEETADAVPTASSANEQQQLTCSQSVGQSSSQTESSLGEHQAYPGTPPEDVSVLDTATEHKTTETTATKGTTKRTLAGEFSSETKKMKAD